MKNIVHTFSKKTGDGSRLISCAAIMIYIIALMGLSLTSAFADDIPIAIGSDEIGMKVLTGKWVGEYSSDDNSRNGYIEFSLSGKKEKAIGEISMVSKDNKGKSQSPSKGTNLKPLPITFVEIARNKVSGTVVPFFDPKFDSIVHTVFVGMRHGGEVLEGTFTSTIEKTGAVYAGNWKVVYAGRIND